MRRNKKPHSEFWESAKGNSDSYIQYRNRLIELGTSMFEWKNLPDTIDPRYLELALFTDGMAVFFKDEDLGYLGLRVMIAGEWNVYHIPVRRTAFSTTHYRKELTEKDSVIIFNNYLHTNSLLDVEIFSKRLENLDRAIDVNANAQKTPILLLCDEDQKLALTNLYQQYDGNMPVIKGMSGLNVEGFKVLNTGAPYVADRLYQLKTQIWNEALTYLGISNVSFQKKERMLMDEVTRSMGSTMASRASRLEMRRQACREINAMFGLNIWCDFRDDYRVLNIEDENENKEDIDNEQV